MCSLPVFGLCMHGCILWLKMCMCVCVQHTSPSQTEDGSRQVCTKVCAGCKHIPFSLKHEHNRAWSELRRESAYHFKNNHHSERQLHFLSVNVCVCGAETGGQRVHGFSEQKRPRKSGGRRGKLSPRGPLGVWDWDRRTRMVWPWGSIRMLNSPETERMERNRGLSCLSVSYL